MTLFLAPSPFSASSPMKYSVDILLLTVAKIETVAMFDVFRHRVGHEPVVRSIEDMTYHDLGSVSGMSVWLVQAEMGSGGVGASQQTVTKAIAALSPKAVIMSGIAFGVDPTKQAIGDVLISQRLMLYEPQRIGRRKKKLHLIPRGDRPHASRWLYDRFRSAELSWKEATVHFGLILTGEKLVDNLSVRKQLVRLEPEAIGGEMESGGLYVACHEAKVDWIIAKAICDWGDGYKRVKKKERQKIAAHNAASFVLYSLLFAPLPRRSRPRAGDIVPQRKSHSRKLIRQDGCGGLAIGRRTVAAGAGGVAVGGNVQGGIHLSGVRRSSRKHSSS